MVEYTLYFLGPDQRVVARSDFESGSDDDAVIEARALYAERKTRDGFELWEHKRRVHSEDDVPLAAAS